MVASIFALLDRVARLKSGGHPCRQFRKQTSLSQTACFALAISIMSAAYMQNGLAQALPNQEANLETAITDAVQNVQVQPPQVPERSLPKAVSSNPATVNPLLGQLKPSLSWRQKASRLAAAKFKTALSEGPLLRSFAANYSDTLMALVASCANLSFQVQSLNSNAGEILASSPDNQIRLIFAVWEQPAGKTWVAAGIDKGPFQAASKIVNQVFGTTGSTVSRRGRI